MQFGMYRQMSTSDAWRYAVWRTRSKVKVKSPWKSENRRFSKAISFPIYNGGWQMTTDSEIRAQYLQLYRGQIFYFCPIFVSRDFEVGSK